MENLPFAICSAPEVFQRRMHELADGLCGVEVITDDFLVVGFGDNILEATIYHEANLKAFLQRCNERGVHQNTDKVQLQKDRVSFIGHVILKMVVRGSSQGKSYCEYAGAIRCSWCSAIVRYGSISN